MSDYKSITYQDHAWFKWGILKYFLFFSFGVSETI